MHKADKILLMGFILLISLLGGVFITGILSVDDSPFVQIETGLKRIYIGNTPIKVEIADTPDSRIQGLSGRERLPENTGMLFVFDEPGIYKIWMREMKFPLDIYWINKAGVIIDIWENAQPESYPRVYTPASSALYILEVPAGFSEIYNISIGSRVKGI